MAWATHWKIQFQSILGTDYTLNIMEEGYSGNIITLTGASNPFETQEDNSTDPFKTIRSQSGKINIITSDPTLLPAIMPSGNLARRVELIEGSNSLRWRGFIPANAYSQPIDNAPYQITVPVQSVLSSLDNAYLSNLYGQFMTIGDVIYTLFQKAGITLGTDANMYFQTEMEDFTDYLKCTICCSLFYDIKTTVNTDSPVQQIVAKSCSDVLEAVLKPMGFSIHEYRGNFYVVSNVKLFDNSSVVHFIPYDFINKQAGNPGTTGKRTISSFDSYISSDKQKISFTPGAKEVSVTLDINDSAVIDSGNPSTPYSMNTVYGGASRNDEGAVNGYLAAQKIDTPATPRRELWTEVFYQKYHSFLNRIAAGQKTFTEESATPNEIMTNSGYNMDTLGHKEDTPELFGQQGVIGATLCRAGDGRTENDVNLEPGLIVNMNSAYRMALYYGVSGSMPVGANDVVYVLRTNESYTFKSGYIHLDADWSVLEYYRRGFIDGVPNISVFIGNTEINASGPAGYHIENTMTGQLRIVIYGGWPYPFKDPYTVFIKNLRLYWSIRAEEITASQESSNLYMTLINKDFTDKKNINTQLGTDNNNKATSSILYNDMMQSVTKFNIYDGSPVHYLRAEKYLLQMMEQQYTDIQRTISRSYRRVWNVLPGTPFTQDGINYMFILEKVKWIDDDVTVKFIQTYQPS
ncbi:MAG: hypothetical protein IKM68_00580 [Bacteroidaceae bacterium]|nr:hypothetical protein [Bacteroidaceae bacterium]